MLYYVKYDIPECMQIPNFIDMKIIGFVKINVICLRCGNESFILKKAFAVSFSWVCFSLLSMPQSP